jgi:D-aspartate ligase
MPRSEAPAVLLGGSVNALSAARSLGGGGVEVHVLAESGLRLPVAASRHVRSYVADDWLPWLEAHRIGAVLLPCSDRGLELLARHRARLVELGHRPVEADDELILALLDKARTAELAADAGIPAPRTFRLDSPEAIDEVVATIAFPCAVKPLHPHRAPTSLWAKGAEVDDADALVAWAKASRGLVATEIVPGPEDAFCSFYTYMVDGEPLFGFTKRKLRQFPVRWGTGTYHLSEWVPDAAEAGRKLFEAVGLVGLGNVEFKRDVRDGTLKLIECNLRLTEADPLLRASGLDLAHVLYERALGRTATVPEQFEYGKRQWLPLADTRAFLAYRAAGTTTTGEWLRSLLHPQVLPFFAAEDPGPSLRNLRTLAGRVARWVRR